MKKLKRLDWKGISKLLAIIPFWTMTAVLASGLFEIIITDKHDIFTMWIKSIHEHHVSVPLAMLASMYFTVFILIHKARLHHD